MYVFLNGTKLWGQRERKRGKSNMLLKSKVNKDGSCRSCIPVAQAEYIFQNHTHSHVLAIY